MTLYGPKCARCDRWIRNDNNNYYCRNNITIKLLLLLLQPPPPPKKQLIVDAGCVCVQYVIFLNFWTFLYAVSSSKCRPCVHFLLLEVMKHGCICLPIRVSSFSSPNSNTIFSSVSVSSVILFIYSCHLHSLYFSAVAYNCTYIPIDNDWGQLSFFLL